MNTPSYIQNLVIPQAKTAKTSRRVWSIDLEQVWLPFFHATNANSDTAIPSEALGAPLRLSVGKDGTVRFNQSGKPVIRVVKDISDMVRLVRDNFTAGLLSYTHGISEENPDGYNAEIAKSLKAGEPIMARDIAMLTEAVKVRRELEAEATLPAVTDDGPGKIAVNVRYLLEYCSGKEDFFTMGITDDKSPAVLNYHNHPVVVMMPMFVEW